MDGTPLCDCAVDRSENLVTVNSFSNKVVVVDGAVDVESGGRMVFNVYDELSVFVADDDDVSEFVVWSSCECFRVQRPLFF